MRCPPGTDRAGSAVSADFLCSDYDYPLSTRNLILC